MMAKRSETDVRVACIIAVVVSRHKTRVPDCVFTPVPGDDDQAGKHTRPTWRIRRRDAAAAASMAIDWCRVCICKMLGL